MIGGAIGCYLRFRGISGDPVARLLAAIPRAAHWHLASLPEVRYEQWAPELPAEGVRFRLRILGTVFLLSPIRDRAIDVLAHGL